MSSIDHSELFELYYQNKYDFNTASLTKKEIEDVKTLAREKRVNYGIAPMGTGIFRWILNQDSNIRFELVTFDSKKIDGMLYIPTVGEECAYIILNAMIPLINQIFATAHEYYHYIRDYQKCKETPYICDFSMLKNVNEMCASRFAAELLLPEEALERELRYYMNICGFSSEKEMGFENYAVLIIYLTVTYQLPLKAVIYRLVEEHYIENIEKYIKNYEFIKKVLQEIEILKKQVNELYGKENRYVIPYNSTYADMKKAFQTGNVSREDILRDAVRLGLDMNIVRDFLDQDEGVGDEEDDEKLFSVIASKWG